MEPTTDEMLIILPQRFLVMPFVAALVIRKTEFRFVLITSNHCSSFILIINVSFVMPALLTRMSGGPYFSVTAFTTSSTFAESVTSNFIPSPFKSPSKRAEMASAPESEVAVPTTTAPAFARRSAMAAPMPREAPVTTATLPVRSKPVSAPAFRAVRERPPLARGLTAGLVDETAVATRLADCCHPESCTNIRLHPVQRQRAERAQPVRLTMMVEPERANGARGNGVAQSPEMA
mmetsp:Transcript_26879/g.62396  ORF Transcript_26879/g.62396 Transcript_26879/m.62396 type:complete len:234 (+) Transcript_26879:423-1124(+)